MKNNNQILEERLNAFNAIEGPRVGDYLKLPYGLYTRFTHLWDESIQTGGSAGGSYYLCGSGGFSYSGGLDSGVQLTDIRLTEETKEGSLWFFDQGISGAGRGVYFTAQFRVFEPIEGANLKEMILYYDGNLITNWPGTLKIRPLYTKNGYHNIAGSRVDIWFTFENNGYHGVQYGKFTQVCHIKKLK